MKRTESETGEGWLRLPTLSNATTRTRSVWPGLPLIVREVAVSTAWSSVSVPPSNDV